MTVTSAGLRSLAVAFPGKVRTNEYYRLGQPDVFEGASQRTLARMWAKPVDEAASGIEIFDEEMAPFLDDPFRGTVERRVLAPGERVLDVELRVARQALDAANLAAGDIDLLISSAFVPDHVGIGHAAFLARELAIGGTAWNLETACASALEGLRTASALVRAGEHRHVLVVASCMYSKVSDDSDTLTWFLGDGACAFVVSAETPGYGVLGAHMLHTGETCGAIYYEFSDSPTLPRVCVRADKSSGKALRETSVKFLRAGVDGALRKAGVSLEDIRFFAFNTPTAWYARFCARALGVDPERTISCYAETANIGPVLMPTNLFRAAREGRIKKGDLVLLYSVGSVSSAGAVVIRWGDVALGPDVEPAALRE